MNTFTQTIHVGYSDVGPDGRMKPISALNLCQDIASVHAHQLGVSAIHMGAAGLTWMIHRYNLIFYQYPEWNTRLSVTTGRAPLRGLYEIRKYRVTDENDNPVMDILSAWVLVNQKTGKPVRLARHMPDHLMVNPDTISFDFSDMLEPEPEAQTHRFNVRKDDQDFNLHANNTAYFRWALEALPQSVLSPCGITNTAIRYHHDIASGQAVRVQAQPVINGKNTLFHIGISDAATQTRLATLCISAMGHHAPLETY